MHYHNITTDDMLNGDGLRTVLWVAGCNHKCKGGHNPITWDINGGLVFDDIAKAELFEKLNKPWISGITFSGGDPLHPNNRETIGELIKEVSNKFPNKTIWLYTGYSFEDVMDLEYMPLIDVLVDGKFIKKFFDSTLHWKGSSNQRVIDVKKSLKLKQIVLHA